MTYLLSQMEDLRIRLGELTQRLNGPGAEPDSVARDALLELIDAFEQLSSYSDEDADRVAISECDLAQRLACSGSQLIDSTPDGSCDTRSRPSIDEGKFSDAEFPAVEQISARRDRDAIEEVEAIVVMVSADGKFVVVNDVARRLLDGDSGALGPFASDPAGIFRQTIPHEYGAIPFRILNHLRAGNPPPALMSDVIGSDGRSHRIKWSTTAISDETGKITQVVYSGHDVSVERDLRTQLATFDRLDSVGRLAGGLTHDFNNLLTIAGGNLELALDIGAMDEMARSRIEAALDAIEHGGEIAHRLLKVASHSAGSGSEQRSETNVVEVVNGLVEMLSGVVGAGIRINVAEEPPVGVVEMDALQLEQVILNLITNACDAMNNRGSIVIAIRELQGPEGAYVELSVRDDGPGIEPSRLEDIFAPFSTDANAEGHTGLGLSTVRLLVESAGGSITATSQLGIGTEMTLNLPRTGSGGGW